jgi:protein-tyrosine-phosphatase
MKKTVLFVCVGNSGRSQMAEAFFQQKARTLAKGWNAVSAGIKPDESIHQWTVQLMKEIGMDMSRRRPKPLTIKMLKEADRIVAMDSDVLKQIPPEFLSKTENWNTNLLLGRGIEEVRQTRDEIKTKVERLFREIYTSK